MSLPYRLSFAGARTYALALLAGVGVTSAYRAEGNPQPEYRSIDGYGNNQTQPNWGTPGEHLLRGASGAHYADGISSLGGAGRPSPRVISNAIFAQSGSLPSRRPLSDFMWTWGQFIDHDVGLTEGNQEPVPVAVPSGDPHFDPMNTGRVVLPFRRALYDLTTGTGRQNPRQQINEITSFIDGSMVYGSDPARAAWLRQRVGGRLKISTGAQGPLLPYNDGTQPNAGSPEAPDLSTSLFVAGDIRVNEQPTLACMHTLFVLEHNHQADQIRAQHPALTDEVIYQRARQIVIAEIQAVTYNEFLPALLGENALGSYRGYVPNVNPGLSAVFSTAAFRLGHTLLSPVIQRLGEGGNPIPEGPLPLRDAFFSVVPPILEAEGIEPLVRGVAAQRMQELDAKVVDDVRNFLFGPPGSGGLDLISLNIQRGRDLGLADFNTVRADYGLRRITSFGQITQDQQLVAVLAGLYGNVDNMDAFVGFMVEDDAPGKIVGETLRAVLIEQFDRLRHGDRFWYERALSGALLSEVQRTRLSDIIKRNTRIGRINTNVFRTDGN